MSINSYTINARTINSGHPGNYILSANIDNFVITLQQNNNYIPSQIGNFFGGPIISINVINGQLNGDGGSLSFFADPGISGNLYFGGLVTTTIGTYTGQIRLYGPINFITINFTINVIPNNEIIYKKISNSFDNEEEFDLTLLELPSIEVNIEFMDNRFSQILDREVTDDVAIVTISNFTISNL